MPDLDPSACTNAELVDLASSINAERLRRNRVDEAPRKLGKLFLSFVNEGEDPTTLGSVVDEIVTAVAAAKETGGDVREAIAGIVGPLEEA